MKKCVILFIIINLFFATSSSAEPNSDFLKTNSKNIIAIDRKTLSILYQKNAFDSVAMASTTKIMTCILALENSNLNEAVTVSKKASTITGSTLGLKPNQKISVNDLLYGLMLRSGNDCAIAIAEHISGSVENFSVLMNLKASELNLQSTHFVTPHGLDNPKHYTSAYDLAILTNYALNNNIFKKIVSTKEYSILVNNQPRKIRNTNELLGVVDGVYGVKTGFTFEAGRCLVSACRKNDFDIIVVVLGASTKQHRTSDSKRIINYVFDNYEYINIEEIVNSAFKKTVSASLKQIVTQKTQDIPSFSLEPLESYDIPLRKEDLAQITSKSILQKTFSPYNTKNSIVGHIYIYNNGNLIFQNNILIDNSLTANNFKFYFLKCLSSIF